MATRRQFIKSSAAISAGITLSPLIVKESFGADKENHKPIVISTWKHGMPANEAAWKIISQKGYALDAVESGVRVPEADPNVNSVGYGGRPDKKGNVTLDASIMNENGNAGSVSFLKKIKHPISVARMVMEKTPHVMLSGKGALKFALKNGFEKEKLLTREMRKKWKKEKREFSPEINVENHDTIGMLAMDEEGKICGACTTSGLANKLPGRVGDSPIIGAGLFVDGEVGAAAATGVGELAMKTLGSFLVVEMMRNGMTPRQACREAIIRVAKKYSDYRKYQLAYIAINTKGEYGAFSIQPGFEFSVKTKEFSGMVKAESFLKNR